jgi:glycosyltransferase involved in cell wall biosynthesis
LRELVKRISFTLDIFGTLSDEEQIRAEVKKLSLQEFVRIRGYVPEKELDAALRQASLAINLRWPSMGEASASQLRIWSCALPSMVTRTGWYADLPEETVLFVDPAREAEDISRHLVRFAEDPDACKRIGKAGSQYLLGNHKPEEYVKAILGLASDVERLRRSGSTNYLVGRTAEEFSVWSSQDAISDASLSAARAIASLTDG